MKLKKTVAAAALLMCCEAAWAGAPQPFSDELFLDWNDLRDLLREQGFDFRIGYVSETATNAQGGAKELWRYTDQWTFAMKLDLQKLFGLKEALFDFVITDRDGHNLSADANLGNLQEVQEVYGRGQTWRFTELWYDQKYFNDRLDWKFGKFPEGDDFASFSCEFMNLTFCGAQPGNLVGSYWYNWPVSQWATRIKANFTGFGYVELGAYEINPSYLLTRYALDVGSPPGATGVLAPVEIAWLPTFGKLAGSYKFGAWYNSSTAPDVVDNTSGELLAIAGGKPLMRHGLYGGYINFQQRLTGEGSGTAPGLSVFLNATYADRRTSTLDSQVTLGMLYTGPFAWRPADELGFAVGETHVNPRVAGVERLENELGYGPVGVQASEWVGEVFYNIHAKGWLDLRPNVQYIVAPGGVSSNTSDVIVGLKLLANL
jgi:porin